MITAIIDTCVIIDALQKREPFWKDAEKIFLAAANERFTGIITANAVTDIYYLHHRCTHDAKKTKLVLNGLLDLFCLADTTSGDCRNALLSGVTDFEDAVMIESAKRMNVNCIVTRNQKDFKNSTVPALSPEEFICSINSN